MFDHSVISASSLEVDLFGKVAIIGGTTEGEVLYFYAFSFDSGIKVLSELNSHENSYGRPFKIKRMKGFNYFAVACVKHIVIIRLQESKLYFMKSFLDVHSDNIYDIYVVRNMIFSKGRNESVVKVTYFGDEYTTVAKISEDRDNQEAGGQTPQLPKTTATLTDMDVPMRRL